MYRKPSEDEEQPEDTQTNYQHPRRKRATPYRYPVDTFHPDEHPEIPQIRRASLRLNAQNGEKASQQQGKKATPSQLRRESGRLPVAKSSADPRNEEIDHQQHPRQNGANRSIPSQRPRSSIYQQPTPPNRVRNNRQQSSLKDHLQSLSHRQTALIVGTLVLVMLILTPFVITGAIFNIHRSSQSTTLKGTPVPIHQQPADSHAIVIIPSDTDHPPPPVFAQSAYLLDADTGVTLYAYNPFKHIPMLSTTKLMTAVIALEIGNPAQKITITSAIEHDIRQLSPDSSVFGVKQGETYTLSDLLYGLLLMSGNDAAVVIADGLSGNIQNFVAKMNQKALQLGMYDTHYMNPHGLLEPGHYSSAHDLAVIGRYSMSIPLIHQITGTRFYHLPPGNHPDRILINGDQFLWWYPGVDGGKPGWDAASNFLQVISATRNHHHLIGVVMHSINFWTDMRDLLNWGFDDFTWISPHDVDRQHPIVYDSDSNYFASDKKETTIPTADNGRYYIYTGFSISGPIMAYFDQGGSLKKFGYPISLPLLSSTQVINQRFEHATIQCILPTKQCTAI